MAQAVVAILQQVLPRDPIVPVVVQLPEATVEYIEVLVAEISCHLIDVLLFVHLLEGTQKVRPADLTGRDLTVVAAVHREEDAGYDGDSVFLLELSMVGEELESLDAKESRLAGRFNLD